MTTKLEDIRARATAATPGPWRALTTGVAGGDHWYVCDKDQSVASIHASDGEDEEQRQPDAMFIAHAREDVPRLLAALEAVQSTAQKWLDAEPIDGTEKSQQWYSLGKRHAAEAVLFEIREALEGYGDAR